MDSIGLSIRNKIDKWEELFNQDSLFNADRERRKRFKFGWTENNFTTMEQLGSTTEGTKQQWMP